ncbi:MlaD family protein [Aquabacterium sp. OR-4]|uniref:MlaD family protein n=1 Tax=Aquabacterium sp. OR-4 TaxID=2978127 RepID=UPI0028C57057|nr:MlaD family protein [Aquabacterium sp. OR-4]MDT7835068.1 MlaD family protein [Aquabacterium sp. OR-4]
MNRRGNATLIGLFVVVGLALVAAGVLVATGGRLFARKEQAVLYFQGSIYGLQVGAPVMFRGVRLGAVSAIGLQHEAPTDQFTIPVRVELDRDGITTVHANGTRERRALTLADMVARGLSAQLSLQSLLTGQQYVDLDLRPDKPGIRHRAPGSTPVIEIPTTSTTIQNLKAQLESLDVRALADDVSGTARAVRDLVSGPALRESVANLQRISADLRQVSATLARRTDPAARELQATLHDTRAALARLGQAADRVGDSAQRVGSGADRVAALADPQAPLLQALQRTADELALAAAGLRSHTQPDAPLAQDLSRTLNDVSRASRSLGELADLLERHPDALLRGRPREQGTP